MCLVCVPAARCTLPSFKFLEEDDSNKLFWLLCLFRFKFEGRKLTPRMFQEVCTGSKHLVSTSTPATWPAIHHLMQANCRNPPL